MFYPTLFFFFLTTCSIHGDQSSMEGFWTTPTSHPRILLRPTINTFRSPPTGRVGVPDTWSRVSFLCGTWSLKCVVTAESSRVQLEDGDGSIPSLDCLRERLLFAAFPDKLHWWIYAVSWGRRAYWIHEWVWISWKNGWYDGLIARYHLMKFWHSKETLCLKSTWKSMFSCHAQREYLRRLKCWVDSPGTSLL